MATDANGRGSGRDSSEQGGCVTPRVLVALKYRSNQIFVNIESVCGCTDIQRLSRIPGASKGVKGLILFKGEVVPLISFFGGATERSPREPWTQKGKTDDYAVVLSIKRTRLAARVDEPPRICTDRSAIEKAGGNDCYMRRKHLERLFELCVARCNGGDQATGQHQTSSGSRCNDVARADDPTTSEDTHGTEEHGHGLERETTATIADPCCAT
jgi:chemotaxis signal transduction protein